MESPSPESVAYADRLRGLRRVLLRPPISPNTLILLLSLAIGIGTGLTAILFRFLIHAVQHLLGLPTGALLGPASHFGPLIALVVGALLAGPIIYFVASEAKGHGVPEVMAAVALQGGRVRRRVAVAKSVASALCIGSGGSAGREGPIVQIG